MVALAPWIAFRMGLLASERAGSAALLLAARRLIAEPRPAGRAGAAIGGITLVSGGAAAIAAEVLATPDYVDGFWVGSLLLVGAGLMAALLVVTSTLAVHSVESMLDRKRPIALLSAAGTPVAELQRAQRHEAALAAMPLAALGLLLGSAAVYPFADDHAPLGLLVVLVNAALTLALVWLAIRIAVRAVRPWLVRATLPGNLRTE
jgi:hypothetical protein